MFSITVVLIIGDDYEGIAVEGHTVRLQIFDPDMTSVLEESSGVVSGPSATAVPRMHARALLPIRTGFEVTAFGTYTVSVNLGGGKPRTLHHAVVADAAEQ